MDAPCPIHDPRRRSSRTAGGRSRAECCRPRRNRERGADCTATDGPRRIESLLDRFYTVIERIPRGRVATYGQIARLAGLPRHARHVGRALRELPDEHDFPWHRVVNSAGGISARSDGSFEDVQRVRLEREGVAFEPNGRVPLRRFGWMPDAVAGRDARRGTRSALRGIPPRRRSGLA